VSSQILISHALERDHQLVPQKTAIYQANQHERIDELVATMADMYAFMDEAQPMEKIELHAKILAVMAKQTAECAYFIHEYAKSRSFGSLPVPFLPPYIPLTILPY